MTKQIKTPLVAEDIHKSFKDNKVLKGVSLKANQHDVITLLGSSGSGKSTLLRCLNLLEIPDSGQLKILDEQVDFHVNRKGENQLVHPAKVQNLRARLSMVFQQFNLWTHMTVLENVMAGPLFVLKENKAEVRAKAEHYLAQVGLSERMNYYPSHLSGGQQQRAAIARALAMEPAVMLFDEPTSALDPELVEEVLTVIQNLAKEGRTMVLVTHEMSFAKEVSSEIIFLHQGLVDEKSAPNKFFNHPDSERVKQFVSSAF